MVHALEVLIEYLQGGGFEAKGIQRIEVFAGDSVTCARLHAWFMKGAWRLQSEAAAKIAQLCYKIAEMLPCPMSLYSPEMDRPSEDAIYEDLNEGWTVIHGTRIRAGILLGTDVLKQWKGRIARVPLTAAEVKEQVTIRYEADELQAIKMLRACGSVSSEIYTSLELTRAVIRGALGELRRLRAPKVTMNRMG